MKIINETELMNNQKASTVIVPDVQFEAVQTASGNSLVFSLNESGILNCTCEVQGDTHGWTVVDLSSAQAKTDFPDDFTNKTVKVTHFDLGQDPVSRNVDLVMVLNANNQDYLYVSLDNATDTWVGYTPKWTYVKFDDPNYPAYATAPINDVYLARYGSNMFAFVDLATDPVTHALTRYAVDYTGQTWMNLTNSSTPQCWIPHNFPMTVQAGSLTSTIGCGPGDVGVNGVYTLGVDNSDANVPALVYSPLFGSDPTGPGYPTDFDLSKLDVDVTHMAIAVSARNDGMTDLFFASNGSLYFIPNEKQIEVNGVLPTLTPIYTHSLLQKVTSLHVNTWNDSNNDDPNGNIVLWGQSDDPDGSGTSQLFIMECAVGHEPDAFAWSCPIPLLFNVVNSATYINNNYSALNIIDPVNGNAYGSCNVLFAEQVIDKASVLTQLFQDPVTTAWQVRSLLTAPDTDNIQTAIYDTTTYSTHIEITDDNNISQINVPVAVWASSPCSVYINDAKNTDAYFTLDTEKPFLFSTDVSANVTIMQPVDTIGGISYYVAVQDPVTKQIYTEVINPLSGTSGTISTLNTKVPDGKDHLQGVQVTDEYGTTTQLVSSTYDSRTATTSNNINTFCQQNAHLNQDGLVTGRSWPDATAVAAAFPAVPAGVSSAVKPAPGTVIKNTVKKFAKADRPAKNIRFNAETGKIWGWTFGKNAKHYEGIEAMKEMGLIVQANGSLAFTLSNGHVLDSSNWIEIKAGHLFKWMKSEADKLQNAVATFENGVIDCVLTIAGEIYHFVAKCASDIVNLVHTVLNAIEVAFEDIVKWIGFIFDYDDILRTHAVIKNFLKLTINYAASNISTFQSAIQTSFTSIQNDLNALVGLPQISDTPASTSSQNPPPQSSKTPQANWGTHKLKSNGGNTNPSDPNFSPGSNSDPTGGKLQNLLSKIEGLETTTLNQLSTNLQSIVDNYKTLTVSQIVEQVLVAITDFLISEAQDVILSSTDVMALLMDEVYTILTGPIDIPVISWLYKKMTKGSDFDLLDLVCLVTAIPSTIVYKVIEETSPFPDDDTTTALINAPDFATLLSVLSQPVTGVGAHGGDDISNSPTFKKYIKIANIAALGGAVGVSVLSTLKSGVIDTLKDNKWINAVNTACYLLYVWPDLMESIPTNTTSGTWYDIMNNWCTWVAITKTLADAQCGFNELIGSLWGNIAPWADLIINIAWQAPTCGAIADEFMHKNPTTTEKINSIINFIGGTAFDASGWCSPALASAQGAYLTPDGKVAIGGWMALISLLNVGWGVSCILDSYGPFAES